MEELDLGATIRGFVAGQKVFNRYTLLKQLGRGGMGVVWRARDESLEQDVAIKMLPEIVANDPASVRELKRETSRNQQLSHPHILRVFDFVESGALCGITMEVAEGGTLTQRRLDQPREHFEVAEIRDWVRQLCEALDHAHRRAKVVHRDLKPANLMLTAGGELKVTDFGIAASLSESMTRVSKQGSSSGTPLYMSPQQMMGEKPAVTDDLYSLGATLYELLTGKPPFYAGNVILQVQNKSAPSLAQRRADLEVAGEPIPSEWEETIAACLAKEPSARPQSAREVAERLGLVEGVVPAPVKAAAPPPPVETPAPAPLPVAAAQAQPSRGKLFAVIGVAGVAVLITSWLVIVVLPENRRREAELAQRKAVAAEQEKAAEEEYQEMKRAVARLTPESTEAEMQALSERVASYTNHGVLATPRHREIDAEWGRRYAAWDAAAKQRKQEAADRVAREKAEVEEKRLAAEKALKDRQDAEAEQKRLAQEAAERSEREATARIERERQEAAAARQRDRRAWAFARESVEFASALLDPVLKIRRAEARGGLFGGITAGLITADSKGQKARRGDDWLKLDEEAQEISAEFAAGRPDFDLRTMPGGSAGRLAGEARVAAEQVLAMIVVVSRGNTLSRPTLRITKEIEAFSELGNAARDQMLESLAEELARLKRLIPADGGDMTVSLHAGESDTAAESFAIVPGLVVSELSPALRAQYGIPVNASGLLVRADFLTASGQVHFPAGTLVEQLNRQAVTDQRSALTAVAPGRNIALVLMSGKRRYSVFETVVTSGRAITYTVQRGETLRDLAIRFGVTPFDIARSNGIDPGVELQTGQMLKIPPSSRQSPAKKR